jgi:hypothetical protein
MDQMEGNWQRSVAKYHYSNKLSGVAAHTFEDGRVYVAELLAKIRLQDLEVGLLELGTVGQWEAKGEPGRSPGVRSANVNAAQYRAASCQGGSEVAANLVRLVIFMTFRWSKSGKHETYVAIIKAT